jgi:hypothetical protein
MRFISSVLQIPDRVLTAKFVICSQFRFRPIAVFPAREAQQSAHGAGSGAYTMLPLGLLGSEAIIANILTGQSAISL